MDTARSFLLMLGVVTVLFVAVDLSRVPDEVSPMKPEVTLTEQHPGVSSPSELDKVYIGKLLGK